jgi:large subunit ribosomal protein L18
MSEQKRKVDNASQRATRTRAAIHGTADRPRLSVHVSNRHMSAQIINDDTSQTLVAVTTVGKLSKDTLSVQAVTIGAELAKKAKASKISRVVFDRGSKQYHGRVKALADSARREGLEF